MKISLATLLSAAAILCVTTHSPATPRRPYTARNDTVKQANDSVATIKNRPIVVQDTLRLKLNRLKVDSKAVEIKKFDPFNEKMKEPWLGDLLKNIIFH